MKILTVQGLLLASSLVGGVSYARPVALPTEMRAESPETSWMTIKLETPGTLGVEILYKTDRLSDVTRLRVTGTLNSKDWVTLSNLTSIVELDLSGASSAAAAVPDDAFNGRTSLKSIQLPNDIPSIGKYAFKGAGLETILLPSSVKTLGVGAFQECPELISAETTSVTDLSDNCFNACPKLETVKLGKGLLRIGNYAFYNCLALTTVSIPDGLQQVSYQSFGYTPALEEIIFPSTMTAIGQSVFVQSGVKRIDFGNGLYTNEGWIFSNCPRLEEIAFSGGAFSYNYIGNNCPAIKHIILRGATPPEVTNSFDKMNMETLTITVPDFALVTYKLHSFWGKAATISEGAEASEWIIASDLDLISGHRMSGTPSVTVIEGGKLRVMGAEAMPMEKFTLRSNLQTGSYSQLINAGALMTANSTELKFYAQAGRWYFISFPCDVKIADISHSEGRDFIFRSYDGENRATAGTGTNWKDLPSDGVLKAGQGYICQTQSEGYIVAKVEDAASAVLLSTGDRAISVKAYKSENAANAGWNFIGNPYPSYYDMYSASLTCPITVWDGTKYVAYSLTDDNVVLAPLQGFFMQQDETDGEISFEKSGCQFTAEVARPAQSHTASGRSIFNFNLTDGAAMTDATRIVVNPAASEGYEPSRDAAKFFGEETHPAFYTIGEGGTPLAINERPFDSGAIRMGYRVAAAGDYTIALATAPGEVTLNDKAVNKSVRLGAGGFYTFSTEAGTFDDRFSIIPDMNTVTGISETDTDTLNATPVKGGICVTAPAGTSISIYGADGKAVARCASTGEMTILPLNAGLYVVRVGSRSFKFVVTE